MGARGPKSADQFAADIFNQQRAMQSATEANLSFWRARYNEANKPGFKFDRGDRHYIHGEVARRRYYELHGVPQALVTQWDAERSRS
jgi:hypothetical protein